MRVKKNLILILMLILALLIRIIPLGFPVFTADEARVAFRGYTLSLKGTDELGRKFPLIFNSLNDYQLPVVSYLTALGELIFGKNDFGARIFFILSGVGIVALIYKISHIFAEKKHFWLYSLLVASLSPGLIFFSKFPNEFIILTFLLLFLFYHLTREKINLSLIIFLIVLSLLTSKIAWFTLTPFVGYTLLTFGQNIKTKIKKITFSVCLLLSILTFTFLLQVPQGLRSLVENNFPIIQDVTIKNGIDRLRGAGMELGWNPFLDRILLNKLSLVLAGIFHLFSHLQPSMLFGQIDNEGGSGYMSMGYFPKVAIIPFLIGLIFLIKNQINKFIILSLYIFILIFPLVFMYPIESKGIVVLALPFFIFIMMIGLGNVNFKARVAIMTIFVLEVAINIVSPAADIKNSNEVRPEWIKQVASDTYNFSSSDKVYISDNLTADITPFIQWYTSINYSPDDLSYTDFPYKLRINKTANIKILGSDNIFKDCNESKKITAIVSKRDLQKMQREVTSTVQKLYLDNLGKTAGYLILPKICIN